MSTDTTTLILDDKFLIMYQGEKITATIFKDYYTAEKTYNIVSKQLIN
ncbi:hypothetical protein ACFQ4L_10315 [Lapidilactobacillus mulanensis]|uniref:Uncharacterized protein n=1 Tax=Lapidilactobacillus mulanensis TaxID=2485999 RepID=A0ABW4DQU2_9LACO|nr:hypothetical protein [Lapidilactobacillus mulanensis]